MADKGNARELSLAERAYHKLKEEILRNRFPSGEFLSIGDLSRVLNGMGRTPVREAVQRLHDERLLTVVPRKGVVIPEFDIKKMMDQLEIRHVLERYAAVKAIDSIGEDKLEELNGIIEEMAAVEEKSSYQLARLNMSFHMKIAEAANNRELVETLSRIYDHHVRIYTFFLTDSSRYESTHREHCKILDALRSRKKEAIEKAVDGHFDSTRTKILASILK